MADVGWRRRPVDALPAKSALVPGPPVLGTLGGPATALLRHGAVMHRCASTRNARQPQLDRLKDGRRRAWQLDVAVPAVRPVYAPAELVHVALLHLLLDVLEGTVRLVALAEAAEVLADGHLLRDGLMQEGAVVALHAEPPEPVPAHDLPEVGLAVTRRVAVGLRHLRHARVVAHLAHLVELAVDGIASVELHLEVEVQIVCHGCRAPSPPRDRPAR
mmetsp:Transcript_7988/g.32444  ORF Transcript_7988/g.32444 Transcript_7988/m.32444 type:complete len:217 (+) Transcript_7988:575-1225(+)